VDDKSHPGSTLAIDYSLNSFSALIREKARVKNSKIIVQSRDNRIVIFYINNVSKKNKRQKELFTSSNVSSILKKILRVSSTFYVVEWEENHAT